MAEKNPPRSVDVKPSSFFLTINQFGDMTFDEFAQSTVGIGLFNKNGVGDPRFATVGTLPANDAPRPSVDSRGNCQSRVRQQLCNSCSAQSAVSAAEFCLCRAGDGNLTSRNVDDFILLHIYLLKASNITFYLMSNLACFISISLFFLPEL